MTTAAEQPSGETAAAQSSLSLPNANPDIKIVDIIPRSDSQEADQNSEPSLAVDSLDPNKIIAAAFGSTFYSDLTPYFVSTDGGNTWSRFGALDTFDKSIAWKADGSAVLTAILTSNLDTSLYSTTGSGNFGSAIFTYRGVNNTDKVDQPWIRTGPASHVYIAYNDLGAANGETASILVSTNGGSSFTPVTLDRPGAGAGQDAPTVRLAVDGSTVYAAFTRWDTFQGADSSGDDYYDAKVVVVRSDNGGADGFNALGASGNGVEVAAPTGYFSADNSPASLGQERTASDLAIAVDPNNSQHVVIAYGNAPGGKGSGKLQLTVAESTDGGTTWSTKFTTSATTRSAQPALSILQNGTIGFLYDNYDPATNALSQHFVTTGNDFASFTDSTLAVETNASPTLQFDPYLGDFFDLTCIGNTFYGTFCASNADNGTSALFGNVSFLRAFTGTPGTSSFKLTANGSPVAASIDPFFFSDTVSVIISAGNSPYSASPPARPTSATSLSAAARCSCCRAGPPI